MTEGAGSLTVAEAATELGISERTLRRALREDPDVAALAREEERHTSTGRRRAAVFPPEALETLRDRFGASGNGGKPVQGTQADTGAEDQQTPANGGEDWQTVAGNDGAAEPVHRQNTGAAPSDAGGTVVDTGRRQAKAGSNGGRRRRTVAPVRALIEEKDARILELTAALDHERQSHQRAEALHLGTMSELHELRRRAAELESANAKLIAALPAVSSQDLPAQPAKPTVTGATSTERPAPPETATDGAQEGQASDTEPEEPTTAPRRRWWQIWRRSA